MTDLILDLGTHSLVLGTANEEEPFLISRSISVNTDEPLYNSSLIKALSKMAKETIVGNAALGFVDVLKLHNIIDESNFAALMQLLKESLDEKYLDPRDFGLLVIIPPNATISFKLALQQYLFAALKFKKIAYITPGMAILSHMGNDTGVIVDLGYNSIRIEGFFKGFPNENALIDTDIGAADLINYIANSIAEKGELSRFMPVRVLAEKVLQSYVYCALNPMEYIAKIEAGTDDLKRKVELPNGRIITLDRELFESVEILFNPLLIRKYSLNLIDAVVKSIKSWDRSNIPQLASNIKIIGGISKIPHLINKIEILLRQKFPQGLKIGVSTVDDSKMAIWKGAVKLYNLRGGSFDWIPNPNP